MTYIRDHLAAFVVLSAACLALVIFGVANYSVAQLGGTPAITVQERPSGSPGFILTTDLCPTGWIHSTFSGGSTVEETCSKLVGGRYVAVMFPHEKIANYGRDSAAGAGADPNNQIDCRKIPDWPQDRCP